MSRLEEILNTPRPVIPVDETPPPSPLDGAGTVSRDMSSARNRAYVEVSASRQPYEFEKRAELNSQGNGALTGPEFDTPENTVINMLTQQTRDGIIKGDLLGQDLMDLPAQERTDKVLFAMKKADLMKATQTEVLAFQLYSQGFRTLTGENLENIYRETPHGDIETLRAAGREEQLKLMRTTIDTFVAASGWSSWWEALFDTTGQELIPIYNVLSKAGLNRTMMTAMGIPKGDQPKFFLGNQRQVMREHLAGLTDPERQRAIEDVIKAVQDLEQHPTYGPLIRQFGILESFEAVFQEDVLTGTSSNVGWDKWFGNFETAMEGIFSVFMIARVGGKGLKATFGATDANTVARATRNVGNRANQTRVENSLSENAAALMGVDPKEAALGRLARPSEFVDERTIHLPGVESLSDASNRLEGKIMRANAGRFSRILNAADRQVTQAKAEQDVLNILDKGDSVAVAPSMSTVQDMTDGVYVQAVLSKNGEAAWNSFDELLPDLLSMDPNLEHLTILRRSEGKLVKVELTPEEFARMAVLDASKMTDAELIKRSGEARKDGLEFLTYEREAARRAGSPRTADEILGDEYFLQYEHFRAYHPTDKVAFGADTIRNTVIPRVLLTPNAKFGEELVGSFQINYLNQERTTRLFETMYKPYYKLNVKSKKNVNAAYEWMEDFGKENGVAPNLYETLAQFPDLKEKEILGLVSLRRGMDAQYEVFNRRLFLEWNGLGYKTARPKDPAAARYHGAPLDKEQVRTGTTFYDPVAQQEVKLTKADLETLYNDGGRVLKLDTPMDIPGTNSRNRTTQIIVDGDDYQMGDLSLAPLEYYPGYSYRFYDDPYYIVKRQAGVTVDGSVKSATEMTETAIKTAGSELEATRFLGRAFTKARTEGGVTVYVDDAGDEYFVQRSKDIAQTDQTFKQKETLQREGRLFWDQRNRDRLPNVNGNESNVMDFVKSLERGTALSARVNHEEDVMRAAKHAFERDYSNLLKNGGFNTRTVRQVIEDLRTQRANAVGAEAKEQIREALEIAKYLRQLEGYDSAAVPWLRARTLEMAVGVDRWLNKAGLKPGKTGWLEKRVATADPVRATRSAAFHTFMVFRPFRQALLQMAQPIFLSGLDPLYIVSGRGLRDATALRIGYARFINSSFDAGYSNKFLAKTMGLKESEFQVLLKEFERSGALDVVDVHSFAGGTSKFKKTALPGEGVGSHLWYGTKALTNGLVGTLKKVGFDFGEGMNKIGTFNVAWRRVMKDKGYKSISQLTDEDWAKVKLDTENLSLAMARPNNAGYQSGLLAVSTQFLAFTHKVGLAMIGQNPALKNKDVLKLWAGMFTLFGANMFGARDTVREHLTGMGFGDLVDEVLPNGTGITVIDLLSGGLIQTIVGRLAEDPIDTETFTPVFNVFQFSEMTIEGIIENPAKGMLGPFGNRASAFMQGLEFAYNVSTQTDLPPADKFTWAANMMLAGVFPQYNDVMMARFGHRMGRLYHLSGESLDLQPAWAAMVARGLFGARTMEETAYRRAQSKEWDSDAEVKSMIFANRRFLRQYISLYKEGEISQDTFNDAARIVAFMAMAAPEGRREEVIQGSMLSKFADDDPETMPSTMLSNMAVEGKLNPAETKDLIRQLRPDDPNMQLLELYIDDIYDRKVRAEEEMIEHMLKHNPNIRD
jgi:hypothetical protein